MRKVLLSLAILCLATVAAVAQPYKTFSIVNNTPCIVHVILYGTTRTSGCLTDYNSSLIAIPPGTTTYLTPAAVPGGLDDGFGNVLGATDGFTMARVYDGPTYCIPLGAVNLSSCAAGSVPTVGGFQLKDMGCAPCGAPVSITWALTSVKSAKITIN